MSKEPMQITIDTDWIDSLMGDTPDAEKVLAMLKRHSDTFYDYIDQIILEMIERDELENYDE
jgi:hypothetical protein